MMRREDTLKEDKLNLINPSWNIWKFIYIYYWLREKKFIKFSINFQFTPYNVNTDPHSNIVFSARYRAFIFIVARLISGTKVYCLKRD